MEHAAIEKKKINELGEVDYIRNGEVLATIRKNGTRWEVNIPYIAEHYVLPTLFKAERIGDLRMHPTVK